MKKLFDDNSDSEGETPVLKTNKEYEKVYNSFREKELKQRLKDRGMDAEISDSDDSDTSSDDNDGEDPEFDGEFFKTLASLTAKDPKIYSKDTQFFQSTSLKLENKLNGEKNKKKKILTVKDLERKVMLENEGQFVDDDDEEGPSGVRAASPSLAEKEHALKRQLASVANADDSDNEEGEEWGGLFKKRNKSNEEEDQEEQQYAKWLSGQEKSLKKEDQDALKGLKSYWNNPKLSKDDKFLRDYILKSKHKENSRGIPTCDEVLGIEEDPAQLSEDERDIEQQEEFEKKYNFRFEEPDQDFIKSYPRTIDWSVRASDDRRKEKRAEVKDRKAREKEQHRQELEMLKEIKRKEIQDKINKLKMVTGTEAIPISDDFLNEDFDPEEHDRKMQELFNDEYYQVDEGEEKPEYPDDIEDLKVEDYDNYDPAEDVDAAELLFGGEGEEEGEESAPTAKDKKKELEQELLGNSRGRGKRKRQSKFKQMLQKTKPVFDPEDEKTYGEYIDEYYKMDYEDMIGDVKCRFKYVECVPNDFGLSTAEILLAKSKELNQWAGIKKTVQIRPEHIERNEARVYQAKGQNVNLKKKILKSLFQEEESDHEEMGEAKAKPAENSGEGEDGEKAESSGKPSANGSATAESNNANISKKKRNRNRKKKSGATATAEATESTKSSSVTPVTDAMPKSVNKPTQNNAKKPQNSGVKNGGVSKQKQQKHDQGSSKKKFHKTIKELDKKDATHISENRLRALGINPKKYQSKLIYGNNDD